MRIVEVEGSEPGGVEVDGEFAFQLGGQASIERGFADIPAMNVDPVEPCEADLGKDSQAPPPFAKRAHCGAEEIT